MDFIRVTEGLSPRVRGNLDTASVLQDALRSIPACAGEPKRPTALLLTVWVYPRVCGGTYCWRGYWLRQKGLSPRVRGNLRAVVHPAVLRGSIPACAGEPQFPA